MGVNDLTGTGTFTAGAAKFGTAGLAGGLLTAPAGIDNFLLAGGSTAAGTSVSGTGTLEAWVKTTATSIRVAAGRSGLWWLGMSASGYLMVEAGTGSVAGVQTSTAKINDGNWHHVAFTINAGTAALYADGTRLQTWSISDAVVKTGLVVSTYVGDYQTPASGFTWAGQGGGVVDEVRISSTARYTGATYTTPTAAFTPDADTVGLWHLDGDGVDSSPAPPSAVFAANDVSIVYSPYNWDVTSARALTNCSGAYFSTLVAGGPTKITLNFDVSSLTSSNITKVKWRVDGGGWSSGNVTATIQVPIPVTTANWTKHLVEVVMMTSTESVSRWGSPYATAVKFTGLSVLPATATLAAPQAARLKGLVLGDSITEGIGTLGSGGDATGRSDGTLSYAFALRRELGAEIGQVGFGRQGVGIAGNGSVPVVGSTWKLQAASINRSFAPAPDFVVINMGTNDALNNITASTFTTGLTALLNDILSTITTTRIFVMLPVGLYYGSTVYQAAIAACTTPQRVTFVDTAGWWATSDSGDNLHPFGYANITSVAPRLASVIRTTLGQGRRFMNIGGKAVAVKPALDGLTPGSVLNVSPLTNLLSSDQYFVNSAAGFANRNPGATLTQSTDWSPTGAYSLKVTVGTGAENFTGPTTSDYKPVTASVYHEAAVKVYNGTVAQKFIIYIDYFNADKQLITYTPQGNPVTIAPGTSATISTEIIAPLKAAFAKVSVRNESTPGDGTYYYVGAPTLTRTSDTPKQDTTPFILSYSKPVGGIFTNPLAHWNLDVSNAPLHPGSTALINELVTNDIAAQYNGVSVLNTSQFNSSTYVVSVSHPQINIGFCDAQRKGYTPPELYADGGLKAFRDVPVPTSATSGGGGDGHASFYCPGRDQMHEFWQFWEDRQQNAGYGGVTPAAAARGDFTYRTAEEIAAAGEDWKGFSATWGGRIDNCSTSLGDFPGFTGTTATGLAMQGGNLGIAEMQAGVINHAIALSITYPRKYTTVSYPAKRSDGFVDSVNNIPEGLRLRMDPTINFNTEYTNLHPIAKMIGKAAQKYGFIVVDKSGGVEIETESTLPHKRLGMTDPLVALLNGTPGYSVMQNFPWSRAQALPLDYGKPGN